MKITIALLGLITLAASSFLGVGATFWQQNNNTPEYQQFDADRWKENQGYLHQNQRRHMAFAVQDWLEAERPDWRQVQDILGLPDYDPHSNAHNIPHNIPPELGYLVGCGLTTAPDCEVDELLLINFDDLGCVLQARFIQIPVHAQCCKITDPKLRRLMNENPTFSLKLPADVFDASFSHHSQHSPQ